MNVCQENKPGNKIYILEQHPAAKPNMDLCYAREGFDHSSHQNLVGPVQHLTAGLQGSGETGLKIDRFGVK